MPDVRRHPHFLDGYSPATIDEVVAGLNAVGLTAGERVVELGSGDGRWLREAVARGATAIGHEIDAELARKSAALLPEGATVICGDLYDADITAADVVIAGNVSEESRAAYHALFREKAKAGARLVFAGPLEAFRAD